MLCTVRFDAGNNEISELVQTVCIEIEDLSENDNAVVLNVFLQFFDFDGKKTAKRMEWVSWNGMSARDQMKLVLDILSKLLSMCTSTSFIISDEVEGGDVTQVEFRVRVVFQIPPSLAASIGLSRITGMKSISAPSSLRCVSARSTTSP